MRVTFYGVRGSVPAPGPDTVRYGGNTSCVEVRLADGTTVILDAGTGMRNLGNVLLREERAEKVHLLLSHTHWDHVLGLPFFGPLWSAKNQLLVYPLASIGQTRFQRSIFDDIHFPVSVNDIPARVDFVKTEEEVWTLGSARITRVQLNHPGGAQGFRLEDEDGTTLTYLTDNELGALSGEKISSDDLAKFAEGVDLLIHDSQYLTTDMPYKRGWGHSVVDDVLRLGVLAAPRVLALFHHDPDRTDDALDSIGESGRSWLRAHSDTTDLVVAHEGLTLDLAQIKAEK